MNNEHFNSLLKDLYDIYNPSKKKDVESLVNRYNGKEFDAIKTIIIRYNFKGHSGYDENANRDEYVTYLINEYSKGKRPISKENRLKQNQNKISEEQKRAEEEKLKKEQEIKKEKEVLLSAGHEVKEAIKSEVNKLKENIEQKISQKMTEMDKYFLNKKKEFEKRESLIREVEKKVLNFSGETLFHNIEQTKQEVGYTRVNIENLNFTDSDIKLPSEDVLENLSKGSKMILFNSEGRVCGVEVKDITYDLVSHGEEIVKEIILEQI